MKEIEYTKDNIILNLKNKIDEMKHNNSQLEKDLINMEQEHNSKCQELIQMITNLKDNINKKEEELYYLKQKSYQNEKNINNNDENEKNNSVIINEDNQNNNQTLENNDNNEEDENVELNISNLEIDINQINNDSNYIQNEDELAMSGENSNEFAKKYLSSKSKSFIKFNNNLTARVAAHNLKNSPSYMLALCPELLEN
jgi:hypothetical protein